MHARPLPSLRRGRHLSALLSSVACLLGVVLGLVGPTIARVDAGHAGKPVATRTAQAGTSDHDHCWRAETAAHDRHDDARFEALVALEHRQHAAIVGGDLPGHDAVATRLALSDRGLQSILGSAEGIGADRRGSSQPRAPPRV